MVNLCLIGNQCIEKSNFQRWIVCVCRCVWMQLLDSIKWIRTMLDYKLSFMNLNWPRWNAWNEQQRTLFFCKRIRNILYINEKWGNVFNSMLKGVRERKSEKECDGKSEKTAYQFEQGFFLNSDNQIQCNTELYQWRHIITVTVTG